METKTLSPLRYPGGKSKAIKKIVSFIIPNIPKNKKVCSPFFGGGSIEIYLAKKGYQVYGYDAFQPLVDFWQVLLKDPSKLAGQVQKKLELDENNFKNIQRDFKENYKNYTKLKRAYLFYILNRTSYSGTTLSGGMAIDKKKRSWKRINPRFDKKSVQRLRQFSGRNLTVSKIDFRKSIPKYKNAFIYADPPYYIEKNKFYGNMGDMQFKQKDHEDLAKILKRRKHWILSYNNSKLVRELYSDFRIKKVRWAYGMTGTKSRGKQDSSELLVLSDDIKYDSVQKTLF